MSYQPQIRDIEFFLDNIANIGQIYNHEKFPDFDKDIQSAILEAGFQIATQILAPLNAIGDKQGIKLIDGNVILPDGFVEAYQEFAASGWYGLSAPQEYGGQALPKTLEIACFEMFYGANMAFTMLPTLPVGAIAAISHHANQTQKDFYIPKLISGEFLATMALTEPQAGTDLAALNCSAILQENGTYKLYGQKIFISYGDHNASDNIVHLVLARLPDAPKGTKGISLFLCPKYLCNNLGTPNQRNDYSIIGIEHKMGLHASPTCVMQFDGAVCEILGAPNNGLAAMFTMMNEARIGVGTQGAGVSDRAFCKALEHAKTRLQGVSVVTNQNNSMIIDHPDVKLMLSLIKVKAEAARMICLQTALFGDLAKLSEENKNKYKILEDFLVPIAKAWSTEIAIENTSMAIQIHGGMGFIEETGIAQNYRDIKIAAIYEGTNSIQALDLIGRKLGNDGKVIEIICKMINDICIEANTIFPNETNELIKSIDSLNKATQIILNAKNENFANAATGASQYLMLCGDIIGGYLWLKTALAAHNLKDDKSHDIEWLETKIALMKVYNCHILSRAATRIEAIKMGFDVLAKIQF